MPELPEVETLRLGLARTVVGRTVIAVEVSGPRTVRRQDPSEFARRLTGRRVLGVARRGKYLLVECRGGTLVIHLRMTGRLRIENDRRVERGPHTHAVLTLDDGRELRFVDPRTFGELFFAFPGETLLDEAIGPLGTDAASDVVGPELLGGLVAWRHTTLKALLLDQRTIAGVGNIYADEICFAAGLRPDRRTESLGTDDVARLAAGVAHRDRPGGRTRRDVARRRELPGSVRRTRGLPVRARRLRPRRRALPGLWDRRRRRAGRGPLDALVPALPELNRRRDAPRPGALAPGRPRHPGNVATPCS